MAKNFCSIIFMHIQYSCHLLSILYTCPISLITILLINSYYVQINTRLVLLDKINIEEHVFIATSLSYYYSCIIVLRFLVSKFLVSPPPPPPRPLFSTFWSTPGFINIIITHYPMVSPVSCTGHGRLGYSITTMTDTWLTLVYTWFLLLQVIKNW